MEFDGLLDRLSSEFRLHFSEIRFDKNLSVEVNLEGADLEVLK